MRIDILYGCENQINNLSFDGIVYDPNLRNALTFVN